MKRGKLTIAEGVHSPDLFQQIERHWNGKTNELLLLTPSALKELSPFEAALSPDVEFPERPVFGLFTSGTLGRKLIFYSRKNIESSLSGILSFFDTSRIDSVFCYPQPAHVFGLVLGYLLPIIYRKPVVIPPGPYSSEAHEAWLKSVGPGTLTLGTPTHFLDLIKRLQENKIEPSRSYSSIAGGAPVTRALWLAMRDVMRIDSPSIGYGASELSPGATHLPPGKEPHSDGEIGFALPNLTLEIVPGQGMRAKGPNVCLAVAQGGELHFPEEVWLRDEVSRQGDGSMVFSRRTDLILNRGGEKLSFEEIEALLWKAHGLVAVGVGVEHPRLGQELALVVESHAKVSREQVYQTLRDAHARDFDPKLYFVVPEIPRNANLKIDRKACLQHVELQCNSR